MTHFEREITPVTPEDSTSQSEAMDYNLSEVEDQEDRNLEGARITVRREITDTPKEKIKRDIISTTATPSESGNDIYNKPWPRDRWNSDVVPQERSQRGRNYRYRGGYRRPTNGNAYRGGSRNESYRTYRHEDSIRSPVRNNGDEIRQETTNSSVSNNPDSQNKPVKDSENNQEVVIDNLIEKYKNLFINPKNKCNVTVTDITSTKTSSGSSTADSSKPPQSNRDTEAPAFRSSRAYRGNANSSTTADYSAREPPRHNTYARDTREQSFRPSRYHRATSNRQMNNRSRYTQPAATHPLYSVPYQPQASYYPDQIYQNPGYAVNYNPSMPPGYGLNYPTYFQPDQYLQGNPYVQSIPSYTQPVYPVDNFQQNYSPNFSTTYYVDPSMGYMPVYYDENHNINK